MNIFDLFYDKDIEFPFKNNIQYQAMINAFFVLGYMKALQLVGYSIQ